LIYALWFIGGLVVGAALILALLFFRDAPLVAALNRAHSDNDLYQQRVDRLTEAVARHAGIPVILPVSEPEVLEKSPGWFDRKPKDVKTKTRSN
jgi:hypothetical protein